MNGQTAAAADIADAIGWYVSTWIIHGNGGAERGRWCSGQLLAARIRQLRAMQKRPADSMPVGLFVRMCAGAGARYFAASAGGMLLSLHALSATLSFCGISFAA